MMRLGLGMSIAFVLLAIAPYTLPTFYVTLMLPALAYGIILLGFNLLFGYAGLLSFGHALFVGIGAYTVAVMSSRLGLRSLELSMLVAVVVSVVVAIPVGLLCVRYVKIFFGMLTLAFGMLFHSFLFKFYHISGGDSGIPVARPTLVGMDFASLDQTSYLTGPFYFYCLALLLLFGYLMWRIVHSPFGTHLRASRDNPRKAEYVGVRVHSFRLIAFVISAIYGAIGGVLIAIPVGLADPELAYWTHSGMLVFMTVLGGLSNFFGPVLGAFVYIALQDQMMSLTQYWRLAMGVILILIIVLLPTGLMGLIEGRRKRRASADSRSDA